MRSAKLAYRPASHWPPITHDLHFNTFILIYVIMPKIIFTRKAYVKGQTEKHISITLQKVLYKEVFLCKDVFIRIVWGISRIYR